MDKKLEQTGEHITVEMEPRDIDFFNKLIEGYDNLALVTTLDVKIGRVVLWVSEHTKKDVVGILKNLPVPVSII
ncbi:MAG: DUF4911 domain-containing protein [Bacillota bacterium]